jgi:D-alanyl-D-alanine carboxypeptidase
MTKNLKYLFSALFLSCFVFWGTNVFQNNLEAYLTAQISDAAGRLSFPVQNDRPKMPAPEINAQAAIIVKILPDGASKILLQKNSAEPLAIASLTKLMTASIIFDNPTDFNFSKIITISEDAAKQGNTPKYGNLKAGEKYTLEKLIEIMLVYSSNDAAFALSEVIGTDEFIEKMNKKARDLNMDYTYFFNPTGLDIKNVEPVAQNLNHSTAEDLAKLSQNILQTQPQIFEISRLGYDLPIENGISSLKLNDGQTALGGKTGYTKYGKGSLLFAFSDAKNNDYVGIILGAENEETRLKEMQKIIDWLSL